MGESLALMLPQRRTTIPKYFTITIVSTSRYEAFPRSSIGALCPPRPPDFHEESVFDTVLPTTGSGEDGGRD